MPEVTDAATTPAPDAVTLDTLQAGISDLATDIQQVRDGVESLNANDYQTAVLEKLDTIKGLIEQSVTNSSNLDNNVDYSDVLNHIGELMAVADILMIILCVVLFFGVGVMTGYQVTRWLRSDGR